MLKATAFALFAAFLGAQAAAAQTMTLTSPDITAGRQDRRRAGFQRLWLHRRQHLARALLVGRAEGHEELRAQGLRSRRADRQRLLALGRLQHPAGRDEPAAKARAIRKAPTRLRARCRAAPILAFPATAAPALPRATRRITIIFTIFAVDTPKLDGDENNSAAVVGFQLHFHTLAKAELIGVCGALIAPPAPRSSGDAVHQKVSRAVLQPAARKTAPLKERAPSSERRRDPRNTRSLSIRRASRSSPIDPWRDRICPR